MVLTFENLNHASIKLSEILFEKGIRRKTRGFDCIELSHPIMFCIENPIDRYVNIPDRKASKTLPFGESLALLSGVNDIWLYSDYVPSMLQYSDDGFTMRAGYGPRLRSFIGMDNNYVNLKPFKSNKGDSVMKAVDQLSYVVQTLQKDLYSRQAVMSITDPTNDQFDLNGNLVETKDIPCCRIIQFMVVDGKLDCTSYFRSNDILFGMQQVNIFNNTFIQECVAMILNIPVGKYYHIANNLHYYEDKEDLIVNNFNKNKEEYVDSFQEWKGYGENFSLAEFDACIVMLFNYRDALSRSLSKGITATIPFENGGFFSDWAKVFYRFHSKDKNVHFLNPYLNKLFNNEQLEPNREYVKVKLKGKWKKFPVRIVKSYLKTCERDGKEAIYIGKTDKFGYLNK